MGETKEISDFSERTIKVKCSITGKQFKVDQYQWGGLWCPNPDKWIHPDEVERQAKAEKEAKMKAKDEFVTRKADEWITLNVPIALRETEPSHKDLDKVAYKKAISWRYQGRGLVMEGKIRKGKTRALYQIAMRFARKGSEPVVRTAEQMHRDLATAIMKDQSLHERRLAMYCDCPILFIDDLGKEVVSKRTQSDFFEIVSQRCDMGKPIVMTSNFTANYLVKRYPDSVSAESMYARIKENCDYLKFK